MRLAEHPGRVPFALSHYVFVPRAVHEKKRVLVLCVFASFAIARDISVAPIYNIYFEMIEP